MTTFAGWLQDQNERRDEVGQLARLWKEISPGRIHGLAGVTRHLQDYAEQHVLSWIPEAIDVTTAEFRAWKANPEASSVHAPAVASQLDRIEHMVRSVIDALGIPLVYEAGSEGATVTVIHDQGGEIAAGTMAPLVVSETGPTLIPRIGPGGIEYVEAGSRINPALAAEAVMYLDAETGKPDWAKLYGYADHNAAEEAE